MRRAAFLAFLPLLPLACASSATPPAPCVCTCTPAASATAPIASAPASASADAPPPSATSDDVAAMVAAHKAAEYSDSAMRKLHANDGAGCVADLDTHDRIDARAKAQSSSPKSGYLAMVRAQCLMRVGQCDFGRVLYRAAWVDSQGADMTPGRVDTIVDAIVGMNCKSPTTPRDRFLVARMTLQDGAWTKQRTAAECMSAYQTMMSLRGTVKPRDDDDTLVADPINFLYAAAPACLGKAGDCAGAFRVFDQVSTEKGGPNVWRGNAQVERSVFESVVHVCRGK